MDRAELRAAVDAVFDECVDTRRALHAQPELSGAEHATTGLVRRRLDAAGLTALACPTATGAVYELRAPRAGPTLLLRADIDALPIDEEVDVSYRSRVPGVMHACGHDAHTAILLGIAQVLATRADALTGRVVLVFQPAEETGTGAHDMVAAGLLDAVPADAVLSLHVSAQLPGPLVMARPGISMSEMQRFTIDVRGSGGHGAGAGSGGNVVLAACALGEAMAGVVEGLSFEETPCSCTTAVLRAGTAYNVLPGDAQLSGSLRTFTVEQRDVAMNRLDALCEGVADRFGVSVSVDLPRAVPAVDNDVLATGAVERGVARALGAACVVRDAPALTESDDVGVFLARVPGCHFHIGARPGRGPAAPHHSPRFSIDEECLRTGMLAMLASGLELGGAR